MKTQDYRKEHGISQATLAERCNLHINTINKVERGERVSTSTALAIRKAFGISYRDLDINCPMKGWE